MKRWTVPLVAGLAVTWLCGSSPTAAAWPQIILFHGNLLPDQVAIAGSERMQRFFEALEPIEIPDGVLAQRPHIEVALFWDPTKWATCALEPGCPGSLDPTDAEEQAAYYPRSDERPAILLRRSEARAVRGAAVELLGEAGLPMEFHRQR